MSTKNLLSFILTFLSITLFAQTPTTQDCLGAIPICQPVYSESFVPPGAGNYPNEVSIENTCLGGGEIYSIWYTFTVDQAGDFGFLLTPNNSLDDYDWALFNITNANCGDIYNNPNLMVSCNAAGGTSTDPNACSGPTGATGAGFYNNQGGGCFSNPPDMQNGNNPINGLIPVQAGNTYVLMVSNWSESPYGYTIDFGVSNVNIFDVESPTITDADFPDDCSDQTIDITFSENIQCSSIDALNFSLVAPDNSSIPISSVNSSICNIGGNYDNEFTLQLSNPLLLNGDYNLEITSNGVNDILDNCDNSFLSETITFNVNFVEVPVVSLNAPASFCEGETITLNAEYSNSTYLWQDGSTQSIFEVTQGGTYNVTVTNDCGTASNSVTLEMIPNIITDFPSEIISCVGDTVLLTIDDSNVNIEWSDNSTASEKEVTESGIYSVTISNSCFSQTLITHIEFIDLFTIPLEEQVTVCEGEEYIFDVAVAGATYLWQDGSDEYFLSITESGVYSVTISHQCGTITRTAFVEVIPKFELDLGEDRSICEGSIFLNAYAVGEVEYLWQDNSENTMFMVEQPGVYSVSVSSVCQDTTAFITISECTECELAIPNVFSPNNDGRNDRFEIIAPCTVSHFEINIFDRWGGHVFHSKEYTNTWDGTFKGTSLPQGVYVYSIQYGIAEGNAIKTLVKNGSITILK